MKKIFLLGIIFAVSAGCNISIFSNPGPLGVYKSYDAGVDWQQSNAVQNSSSNISGLQVAEMAFAQGDSATIYLGSVNNGMWVSSDSASSWRQILSKLSVYDFYVDPNSSGSRIFAVGIYSGHGRIVNSTDGGKTWNELYLEASSNNSVNTITVNPSNPQEIYAGLNSGILIKSIDGGTTWSVVNDFKDQILKARYSKLNNALYVLTTSKGLASSTNGGKTWNDLTSQLTKSVFYDQITLQSAAVSRFIKLAIDDTDAGVFYLTTSNGIYKTTDNGKSWKLLNVPIQSGAQMPRAVASSRGGVIAYVSVGNTVFRTTDGGQSWQTEGMPESNQVNKILIDPVTPQILYAGLINQ